MTAVEIVLAIIFFVVAGVLLFFAIRSFFERGFLLNNAYIYATKEERETMNKKGFNDFATKYPQLAEEWSDRNLPLTPDTVNDKSRKNVWWKCRTCGFEWKSVIYSRANGSMCPVCAERAILTGYNDLATTDTHLISEWDFDKNTSFSPEHISRHSMYGVWWKCPLNHSYKARISDRVSGMGCKVCDKEYKSVLPKLAIMVYAGMNRMSVKFDDDMISEITELKPYITIFLPIYKLKSFTLYPKDSVTLLLWYCVNFLRLLHLLLAEHWIR